MAGAPVVPALDPVRIIEPPLPISGSAFWTVKIVPFTLVPKVSPKPQLTTIEPSARRHSAVDVDDPARHPLPALRCEQRDNLRNVLRGPIATERNILGEEVGRSAQ